ncbi:MAG: DUF1365 domain-containing protein [Rudaea sp.]
MSVRGVSTARAASAVLARELASVETSRGAAEAEIDAGVPPAAAFASAIYEGTVRHRRHALHPHQFNYRIAMLYIDLDELECLFDGRRFWSVDRRNLAEFRRSDYLGDPAQPLAAAVRDRVEAATGSRPLGPIRLLAHLRYFGHCFNPVSLYYCYASDGVTLEAILAEITNTPWKERHAYVLPLSTATRRGSAHAWEFDKAFHVSPFLPMRCRYDWRFSTPGASLRVHMGVFNREEEFAVREFDATLVLRRREISAANFARVLLRFPLMTLKVVGAIHWQALRLWALGNPVYDHPSPTSSVTIRQGNHHAP